jgi:hypothetical protein
MLYFCHRIQTRHEHCSIAERQPIHSPEEERRRTCTYCCLAVVGRAYLIHGNQGSTSDWLSPPLDLFHPVASFSLACLIDNRPVCECVWCVCVCECVVRIVHEHNISLILLCIPGALAGKRKLLFSVDIDDFSPPVCVNYSVDSGYTYNNNNGGYNTVGSRFFGECLVRIFRRGFYTTKSKSRHSFHLGFCIRL